MVRRRVGRVGRARVVLVARVDGLVARTQDGQDDRQENEAVEKSEDHRQKENLQRKFCCLILTF